MDFSKKTVEELMEKIYYFAYGSNLNRPQMMHRCPSAEAVGPAMLSGFRLVERHYADIEKSEGSTVYGGLYTLTWGDLAWLDNYEGVPTGYIRYIARVTCGGKEYNAWVYEMTPEYKARLEGKKYCDSYRLICSEGAKDFGIPDAFENH